VQGDCKVVGYTNAIPIDDRDYDPLHDYVCDRLVGD
jgi:hypothetical protein